ncbi:MAG: Hpt domain-containing protein [Acidobacteriota bacterium]
MDPAAHPELSQAINQLWRRHLAEILARVNVLEDAAARVCSGGALTPQQREEAISAAHKLAGVLGSFGLEKGTALARECETLYARKDGPGVVNGPQLASLAAELRILVENRE